LYPGLKTHPLHEVAARQMKGGFGGVVGLETHCQDIDRLKVFVDELQARSTIVYAESLASPETILSYPLHMSHRAVPPADLEALQITAGFFRLSLGFEDPKDIIADFERALAKL
jgi:cystathionine beta-lyase/cystathionine gamma-synthase